MIVFEVCVNFAFKQLFDAVIAVRTQRLLISVLKQAKLLLSRLIPSSLLKSTQMRWRQQPQSTSFLPSLSLLGPQMYLVRFTGGDLYTHWLWHFERTKVHQRGKRVLCSTCIRPK